MPAAGWYRDPTGVWDERWWHGAAWSDTVRIGDFLGSEPPLAIDALVAQESERAALAFTREGGGFHRERYVVDQSHVHFFKGNSSRATRSVPLFGVAWATPRVRAGQSLRGTGDVELHISYPGYAGPTTLVFRNVSECSRAAALLTRCARLARIIQQRPPLRDPP